MKIQRNASVRTPTQAEIDAFEARNATPKPQLEVKPSLGEIVELLVAERNGKGAKGKSLAEVKQVLDKL